MRVVRWVVVAAVMVIVAACGDSPPIAAPDEVATAPPSEQSSGSPLVELVGVSSDPDQRRRDLAALQAQQEIDVAACMVAQGFSHEPEFGVIAAIGEIDDGTRAWAENFGLGVVVEFRAALTELDRQSGESRNEIYVASLTEDQRAAYMSALFGDLGEITDEPVAFEPGGCQGLAFEARTEVLERYGSLAGPLDDLDDRIGEDPRVQALEQTWASCMSALGWSFADAQEMVDEVYRRLLELEEFGGTPAGDDAGLTAPELLDFERQIAQADFDCRAPGREQMMRVRAAYEQEFIADNRELLASLNAPT